MKSKGFVLPAVIILTTVLIAAAIQWTVIRHGALVRSASAVQRIRAMNLARSGLDFAQLILAENPGNLDANSWDRLTDFAPIQTREPVMLKIEDECGKINLNHLYFPSGEPNRPLLNAFLRLMPDGFNSDELKRYYTSQQRPLPFLDLLGLTRFGASDAMNLGKLFTVSGDGRINVNTAPAEVLSALVADDGDQFAQRIIQHRSDTLISSLFELDGDKIKGLLPILKTSTTLIHIRAWVTLAGITATAEGLVRFQGRTATVLRYREFWS